MGGMTADPYSAAISGAVEGLTGGTSKSDQKSDSMFDASGWVVQFGDGKIATDRNQVGSWSDYAPYLSLAAGAVLVWRLTRKKQ